MTNRFDVKVPVPGSSTLSNMEDVGAESMEVSKSGALVFRDWQDDVTIAYAPGQWLFAEVQA